MALISRLTVHYADGTTVHIPCSDGIVRQILPAIIIEDADHAHDILYRDGTDPLD